jgi:hypothetical protein
MLFVKEAQCFSPDLAPTYFLLPKLKVFKLVRDFRSAKEQPQKDTEIEHHGQRCASASASISVTGFIAYSEDTVLMSRKLFSPRTVNIQSCD